MLMAEHQGQRIAADVAARGETHTCPRCREEVVLKRGRIRIAHFAHKPPVDCLWARGETLAHMGAKLLFRDAFAARGLRAEVEVPAPSPGSDRRADVMVWSPSNKPVALELQHASMTLDEIERKTADYLAAGIAVVWIPFVRHQHWAEARECRDGEDGDLFIRRYPARPWERWIHGLNMGEIWFHDPSRGNVWRGSFCPHRMHVEDHKWYDREGHERHTGGKKRFSRRWRELVLWGPYELDAIRIKPFRRRFKRLGPHAYPGGTAARLVVDGG